MANRSMRACLAAVLVAGALSLGNAAAGLADANSDDPQSVGDYAAVLLFSAALIGGAGALASLRRVHAGPWPRAAPVGMAVAAVGGMLAGIGNFVEDGLGVSAFGLLFVLGGLGLIVGLLIAGVSALITAAPWRSVGAAFVLLAIGIIVGEEPGFALVGLTWIVLAVVLAGSRGLFRPA